MGLRIFFAGLVLALAPAGAAADVYKWTDERGVTVLSSVPPEDTAQASNVEVVVKEPKRATRKTAAAENQPVPNEQVLLDRIESLERELRAQQYSRDPAYSPPPSQVSYYTPPYQGGYYTTPPPSYYGDSYYPPSYPSYYANPYVTFFPPVTTVFFRSRPHFHHKHFHKHSSHAFPHSTFPRTFAHRGVSRVSPQTGFGPIRSMHHGRR